MIYFMICYWIKFPSLDHKYPTENSIVEVYSNCNGSNPIISGIYLDVIDKLRTCGIYLTEKPILNNLFFNDGFYEYTVIAGPEIFVG